MTSLLMALEGDAPLVAGPGAVTSRSAVRERTEVLAEDLKSRGTRRMLVQTANPAALCVTLAAAQCVRADVWIVHQELGADDVASMTADLGIQWSQLGDGAAEFRDVREGAPPSGQIHLMTSGTTGKPKLVRHTLESLIGRIGNSTTAIHGGRWLLTYQPTSFAGMQVLLTALLGAGTLIIPGQRHPLAFLEAARKLNATHISGTPTFWRSFLLAAERVPLPELKQITLGGEPVDDTTLQRLRHRFPQSRITHIYASTEGGVVFAVHDERAGFPVEWLNRELQHVRLRVRDGVLEISSPCCMVGYTANAAQPWSEDSWLRTGDLVTVEGDRVFFLGRVDDMINVGGAKVYPRQVEEFLLAQPGVAEARVRGVTNPLTGQVLAADLVLEPGHDQEQMRANLSRRCREILPGFQVPRILRFVDRIAVNVSGKKA